MPTDKDQQRLRLHIVGKIDVLSQLDERPLGVILEELLEERDSIMVPTDQELNLLLDQAILKAKGIIE